MIKKNIYKSLVALMLLATIPACTDEVPVDVNTQGDVVLRPEGGPITSLKNILPATKPGYQSVDGRAYNDDSQSWTNGDELLLKVEIQGTEKYPVYTAYMKLVCDGENDGENKWSIDTENQYFASYEKEQGNPTTFSTDLHLVTPTTGIVLTGDDANFKAIIPEEIELSANDESPLTVTMMYAPDLEWAETIEGEGDAATTTGIALALKDNPSTPTPEVWEVKLASESSVVEGGTVTKDATVWDTNLARVCVETGEAGDVVTLTSSAFTPYKKIEQNGGTYTATTTGTDGIAYFYGTIGTQTEAVTSGFEISLDKIKLLSDKEAVDVFIPTTLFEANPLTSVSLKPAVSYKLDGKAARDQAAKDSQSADKSTVGTYKVSGVKGLLEWAAALNEADGEVKLSLKLEEDIILPQYKITIVSEDPLSYSYSNEPILYDKYGNPTNSNWLRVNASTEDAGFTGTITGNNKVISGLRMAPITGNDKRNAFVTVVDVEGKISDLKFFDAKVMGDGNAAIIVSENRGTVNNCSVTDSKVNGAGNVGSIVATNEGTVSGCHNHGTTVIGSPVTGGTSELVGGIVGHNVGVGLLLNDKREKSQAIVKDCTNSGKVSSHGSSGHNFTGGIVGHSYGFVTNCKNTGSVESFTDCTGEAENNSTSYYTSVAGIVGNCSFGRIIACINEGSVKSTTTTVTDKTTGNRVGGIVGYSGTNSYVVACGNIGAITIEGEGADYNNLGGIVGQLYNSYTEVKPNAPGKVYGSWTKEVGEISSTTFTDKDGIGTVPTTYSDNFENNTCVFKDRSVIVESNILDMTNAIDTYNNGNTDNQCTYTWSWNDGSWPTLSTKTSTNP